MKYGYFIFFVLIAMHLAAQNNQLLKSNEDSTAYELTIVDPGFDSWMFTHAAPETFYNQKYLENWNQLYVSNWNSYYTAGKFSNNIQSYIDYNPNIDYGLALNYKLYWYFQYFEETTKVILIHRKGK